MVQGQNGDNTIGQKGLSEMVETITLGTFYCMFYLFAAPATRNAYKLPKLLCPKSTTEVEKRTMDGLMVSI